jgi:predicted nucleic acid-binding protein
VAKNVVVDAGPVIASLISGDALHAWAKEQFSRLPPPMLTCEPVLSEVAFVLKRLGADPAAVLDLVQTGVLEVGISVQEQAGPLRSLMRQYRDVPMSLADACLVRLTELVGAATVMTFDSDFRIYRRHRRLMIPLLAPEGV